MEVRFASHSSYQIRYHQVFCVKYRKKLLKNEECRLYLKYVLQEICERYEFEIDEVVTDWDHVHLFVWAAPRYSPSKIMQILKSITARMIFKQFPEIRKNMLRWWEFRSDGWYIWTVGEWTNEQIIKKYIQNQKDETKTLTYEQLSLFTLT